MKGCAISGILQFVAWLALGAGIIVLLEQHSGLAPRKTFAPAMFVALLLVIAFGLVFGAVRLLRQRRQLAAALRGAPPRDGKRVVLAGTIHATGEPLISPLAAQRCVAFRYDISRWSGTGRGRMLHVLADGVALTASHLRTVSGDYRLLAVPTFDTPAEGLDSAAKARAKQHLRFGRLAEAPPAFTRPEIEKEWTDDDGIYRRETRRVNGEIDLDECVLSESVIRDGADVVIAGRYSADRRAIVPDPNWAHLTQITTGNPADGARRLRQRAFRYMVIAMVVFAGAAFLSYSAFG